MKYQQALIINKKQAKITQNHQKSQKFFKKNHPKLPVTAKNRQQASPIPTNLPTFTIIT